MANAESKGTSINQHKAAVKSTSSLMLDDLNMLDKELSKDPKPSQPARAAPAKPEPKKKKNTRSITYTHTRYPLANPASPTIHPHACPP